MIYKSTSEANEAASLAAYNLPGVSSDCSVVDKIEASIALRSGLMPLPVSSYRWSADGLNPVIAQSWRIDIR